jgi:methyl-accepting chemotaxis protein
MKIGFKLTAIMFVLSFFSIATVSIVLLTRSRSTITELTKKYATTIANESSAEISKFLETYWSTAETTAQIMKQYPSMIVANRRTFFNILLRGLLEENPELIGVWSVWEPDTLEGNDREYIGTPGTNPDGRFAPYWFRSNGRIDMQSLVDFDAGEAGDGYFMARDSGLITVLDPYEYDVGGKTMLMTTIAAPIRGPDGKVKGVMGLDIEIDKIQEISQSTKPYPDSVTAVFSSNGTVTAHYDTSRIGKYMETERDMAGPYLDDLIKAVKTGKFATFTNYVEEIKEDMEIFVVPVNIGISTSPWSYAVGVTTKTVMAPVNEMLVMTVVISVIVLAFASVAAIILSGTISKPIVKVTETLKDISEGEGDLTRVIASGSKDEIGDLARFFNQTLAKIRNLVVNIKKEALKLSEIGTDLSSNMTETAAAVNEITANIQNIKGQVINQSASLNETNATMKQVVVNINKLNSHIENQSDDVSQASSAIEEIAANINSVTSTLINNTDNVKTLQDSSEIGRKGLQEVVSNIMEIAHDSEGLLEINSVMNNIASQTNLLSMNAAIEAAHAGDAGKGFAVVANEIRKLAESSSTQSKTIGTVLKKIKESIDKISRSADGVITKFGAIDSSVRIVAEQEENIRRAMQEQGSGSKQLLQSAGNLKDITRQVKTGSEEMLNGSKEVIQESQNLEKITMEITGGMNEMASGAEQINIAVNHVNEISGKTREGIETLLREVSLFKVE